MQWYVYFLRCRDNSIYIGITTDLKRRMTEHACGQGGRYTKMRGYAKLLGYEKHPDRAAATKREKHLKTLPRSKKKKLIAKSHRPTKSLRAI